MTNFVKVKGHSDLHRDVNSNAVINTNASEYSFTTQEGFGVNTNGALRGRMGGAVLTETQATDGISIGRFADSGTNIDKGTFTLYKVVWYE